MQTYCLNCKKHTDNIGPKIFKVKNGRPILLSKCATCSKKNEHLLETYIVV